MRKSRFKKKSKVELVADNAIFIAALVLFLVLFYGKIFGFMQDYSNGERAGIVTKFSYKGIVFKSWEGELNQGGMRETTDSEGNSSLVVNSIGFNVSKDDVETIEAIKQAKRDRKPISLEYRQWLIHPVKISHSRVVVEVIDAKSQAKTE